MARKSKVVSPEKTTQPESEVEDEEDDEWDFGPEDGNDVDAASDGTALHPASDSPDILSGDTDTHYPSGNAPVADMGTANSKEEVNTAIRATSKEIHRRNGSEPRAARKSTGKLQQVSSKARNPVYRNPVRSATTGQRRLGPTTTRQSDVYDPLAQSPVKLPPQKARWTEQQPQFSPRRTERKKTQQMSSPAGGVQQDASSPRRSKRVQETQVQEAPAKATTPARRKSSRKATQHDGDVQIAGDDVITYKDFFRDGLVQKHQDEDADAGAVNDNEGDNIDVADHVDDDSDGRPTTNAKKAGRPRKSTRAEKSGGSVETPSPEKRKVGRPKKRSAELEPGPSENTPRRSTRGRATLGDVDKAGAEVPVKRTRGKKAPSKSPQKSQPQRTAKTSAGRLQNRQRRRTQNTGEDQGDEDEVQDQAQTASEDAEQIDLNGGLFVPDGVENPSPQRPKVTTRPVVLQREELGYSIGSDDEEEDQQSTSKTKKRPAGKPAAKANTGVKRRKFGQEEDESAEPEAFASSGADRRRWCGQWRQLQVVFRNLEDVGCNVHGGNVQPRNSIKLRDPDVIATIALCEKATKRFTALTDHSGQIEAGRDPANVLNEIRERIDGFCGTSDEFATDFKDSMKSTNIYSDLIPELVKLVQHAITCYEVIDADEVQEGQVTISHLRIVNGLVQLILDLANAAKLYERPDTELRVVQPVHSGIAVPLRQIHKAFTQYMHNHDDAIRETRRREEEATQSALRLEQEERRDRQQARIREIRKKWEKLHDERMWAEGGIMSWKKREHLKIPDEHVEMDQNGLPFERTEVFLPRVGPPPGLVDEAARREWSMVELSSLCDGLKAYAGPNVFERIFRKYCPTGRELNRYNVTEIVATAAGVREKLIESQRNAYGNVEDWITSIPVWTKGHHALGKENEDRGVVDLTAES